jgi:hypothetical protein
MRLRVRPLILVVALAWATGALAQGPPPALPGAYIGDATHPYTDTGDRDFPGGVAAPEPPDIPPHYRAQRSGAGRHAKGGRHGHGSGHAGRGRRRHR